jgi:hypothetical protein
MQLCPPYMLLSLLLRFAYRFSATEFTMELRQIRKSRILVSRVTVKNILDIGFADSGRIAASAAKVVTFPNIHTSSSYPDCFPCGRDASSTSRDLTHACSSAGFSNTCTTDQLRSHHSPCLSNARHHAFLLSVCSQLLLRLAFILLKKPQAPRSSVI